MKYNICIYYFTCVYWILCMHNYIYRDSLSFFLSFHNNKTNNKIKTNNNFDHKIINFLNYCYYQ